MGNLKDEVADFLKLRGIGPGGIKTEEKPPEVEEEEETETEEEETEESSDENSPQDEDDEESDEEESEEEETSKSDKEYTKLIDQNQELMRSVQVLMDKVQYLEQTASSKGTQEKKPAEVVDFLEGIEDIDDVMADKKAFNTLLNRVYAKGVEAALSQAVNVVTPEVDSKIRYNNFVDSYFKARPDISKYKDYFFSKAGSIRKSNPNLTVGELFAATEAEVRKSLGLSTKDTGKKDKKVAKRKKVSGAVPGGSVGRDSSIGDANDMKSQMAKMLKMKGLR